MRTGKAANGAMIWNAEAEAKLLATIMQVCDVKLTSEKQAKVAEIMGCTPKAISHRITKFRKGAAAAANEEGMPTKTKAAKPSSGTKKGRGKKGSSSLGGDDEDDEEANNVTPPPSDRPKRVKAKRDYAELAGENDEDDEDDGDGLSKKVKIEVGEDIGDGLRAVNEDADAEGEEMDGAGFFT